MKSEINVDLKCDTSELTRNLKAVNKELDKIRNPNKTSGNLTWFINGLLLGILLFAVIGLILR